MWMFCRLLWFASPLLAAQDQHCEFGSILNNIGAIDVFLNGDQLYVYSHKGDDIATIVLLFLFPTVDMYTPNVHLY